MGDTHLGSGNDMREGGIRLVPPGGREGDGWGCRPDRKERLF